MTNTHKQTIRISALKTARADLSGITYRINDLLCKADSDFTNSNKEYLAVLTLLGLTDCDKAEIEAYLLAALGQLKILDKIIAEKLEELNK
jgi:hypothetical protein